ncbi:serine/threonine-protein kinase MRCK alpha, partial [Eurytemora carolleeae]|uniref:serine/threonine-protein kinase MRCK alpha n=1 Tax=Eurytemora carolleeae TaxID=1294199 RepID=UPI000C75EFEA
YLVMDYYCGGDLLTLLSKFEDRLPEDMARFYISEMVLAIHSIHNLRYVHRDIKPDNVLLDAHGHIRLADFGSCLRLKEDGTVQSNVAVGTPDYISPEILRAMEDGQGRYGSEVDWWSLGVCMYEMLYGETPFYAESLVETYGKIMNHKGVFVKKEMGHRLKSKNIRWLGQNGINDFKSHPFFSGVDWEHITTSTAPFIPELGSNLSDSGSLVSGTSTAATTPMLDNVDGIARSAYERRIDRLEKEKQELTRKLGETTRTLQEMAHGGKVPDSIESSGEDSSALLIKLKESASKVENLEMVNQDLVTRNLVLEQGEAERARIMRELERSMLSSKQEKEDLSRDLCEAQEKLKLQSKELKDALQQRKLAMAEYTEVTDKLSEMRQQKQKLSRQVRDKEEELENSLQKIDSLRQDIRKAEKLRRELELKAEEAFNETSKERKLREKAESSLRVSGGCVVEAGNEVGGDQSAEISRLKQQIERLEVEGTEAMLLQQQRMSQDTLELRQRLEEVEAEKRRIEQELSSARERLERARNDNMQENDDVIQELRTLHDKEKNLLMEENNKLSAELERSIEISTRLQADRRHLDDEFTDLQGKKEMVAQWEQQIAEIIQWVNDEKDARGYLQALASKLSEEMDLVKGMPSNPAEKNWKNRRSQKLEKMELLNLQSNLQSEIQAKQEISQELSKIRSELEASRKISYSREMLRKDSQIKELQGRIESDGLLGERSSSQMSFLDQFLKESSVSRHTTPGRETSIPPHHTRYSIESEEGDVEDNRIPSIASSRSNMSDHSADIANSPLAAGGNPRISAPLQNTSLGAGAGLTPSSNILKAKSHQFIIRTFSSPLKCNHCTSLMVGLTRQGVVCEVCGFACHIRCKDRVPAMCPVPPDQTKRPLGIDPTRGIGTAYEGYVKVPKPGGVKKGWQRQFVVVCDFKLFLYELQATAPAVAVSQVLDMRDPEFEVSSVRESDVIHASKKDVPSIFRVTTSLMDPPGIRHQCLMLADSESEKTKWVVALNELHRILKKNKLPDRTVYKCKEVMDNQVTVIKNALSACLIDQDRLVVGTEEGLYSVDLERDEICRVGEGKKLHQVEYLQEEQLIICLAGRQRQMRLVPIRALEHTETEWIKVADTKGCIENIHPCIVVFSLLGDQHPLSLVHPDNQMLGFLAYNPVDALGAIELPRGEFLLIFNSLGVYVDLQGRKSRDLEIMYPAQPTAIATTPDGFLLVYSDTHIDVFDAAAGEWCQTINIRKTRPLLKSGLLNLSLLQELPHVTFLSNIHKEDMLCVVKPSLVLGRDGRPVQRTRRRFSIRDANKQIKSNPDRRSKMISAPSNFNHISHMGPGDGIQIQRLLDLPTTLETADQVPAGTPVTLNQPVQRVKSMFHQSGSKLNPPRLPSHPPPPQRSISHSEEGSDTSSLSGSWDLQDIIEREISSTKLNLVRKFSFRRRPSFFRSASLEQRGVERGTGDRRAFSVEPRPRLPRIEDENYIAGMRSYLNGSGNSGTPPPALGRPLPRPGLMMGRASSSSLPRSPENDSSFLTSGLGTGSGSLIGSTSGQSGQGSLLGSNQSGQGSLGSHSSHDVSYMNIYQNTNHPHLYDTNLDGSPRHSLGSNNSSNLSTPPSPARELGSSSYES